MFDEEVQMEEDKIIDVYATDCIYSGEDYYVSICLQLK